MKIGIIHRNLNLLGGGARLCIELLMDLKKHKHETSIITLEWTDWNRIDRAFGLKPLVDNEQVYPSLKLPLVSQTFHGKWFERSLYEFVKKPPRFDLTINTHAEMLFLDANLLYIHDPQLMTYAQPGNRRKGPLQCVYHISRKILLNELRESHWNGVTLTNSMWSRRKLCEQGWGNVKVLYPPVDTELFHCSNGKHGKPWIVTISWLSPYKNLEMIPVLAAKVPEARFVIVGFMGRNSCQVLKNIKAKTRSLGVEEKVILVPNASKKQLLNIVREGELYLHPKQDEPFGIAVVEAMAAGLVPVVHRSGGPWTDIIGMDGKFGFGFESVEEAAQTLSDLLIDRSLRTRMSEKATQRAKSFSRERFERGVMSIIQKCRRTQADEF